MRPLKVLAWSGVLPACGEGNSPNPPDPPPANEEDLIYYVCEGGNASVDGNLLVGNTFAIVCPLDGTITSPTALALPMLMTCLVPDGGNFPPLAFEVTAVDGDTIEFLGALLDADLMQDMGSPTLVIPPADFSENPCFRLQIEGFLLAIVGIEVNISDLLIAGKVRADRSGFDEGVLAGWLDPVPLAEELGVDVCNLFFVCDENGLLPLRIEDLSFERQTGLDLEPQAPIP